MNHIHQILHILLQVQLYFRFPSYIFPHISYNINAIATVGWVEMPQEFLQILKVCKTLSAFCTGCVLCVSTDNNLQLFTRCVRWSSAVTSLPETDSRPANSELALPGSLEFCFRSVAIRGVLLTENWNTVESKGQYFTFVWFELTGVVWSMQLKLHSGCQLFS